jgi:serine O-acetyltransferase
MFDLLREDIRRKMELTRRDGTPRQPLGVVCSAGTVAVAVYRFGRWARTSRVPIISQLARAIYLPIFYAVQMFTGISVQAYADIGRRFTILNHTCIFVVAEHIGDDFTVGQDVTVGNIRGKPRLPIIGNNVYVEPGAKILGDITIGDNVVVGANSLVIANVPSNSRVIGNPARIIPLAAEDQASDAHCPAETENRSNIMGKCA